MFLRYQVLQVFIIFSALALAVSDSVAKERYKEMQGKKKMYQKKYKELKTNCVPVTTSSPTVVPNPEGGCQGALPLNFCLCGFTKNDCDSDIKYMWTNMCCND